MKTVITAALTSLFAIMPATAEPKPAAAPDANATASVLAPVRGPSTRYCYKTEITGSHIITRVCKTRSDWQEVGVIVPKGL